MSITAAAAMSSMSSATKRERPYALIVGCPRSGTTLLQWMLDHHPILAIANDTHFIPRVVDPDGGDVPLSPELVDQVLDYHRFGRLGLEDGAVRWAASHTRTYAEFVAALYADVLFAIELGPGGERPRRHPESRLGVSHPAGPQPSVGGAARTHTVCDP